MNETNGDESKTETLPPLCIFVSARFSSAVGGCLNSVFTTSEASLTADNFTLL